MLEKFRNITNYRTTRDLTCWPTLGHMCFVLLLRLLQAFLHYYLHESFVNLYEPVHYRLFKFIYTQTVKSLWPSVLMQHADVVCTTRLFKFT